MPAAIRHPVCSADAPGVGALCNVAVAGIEVQRLEAQELEAEINGVAIDVSSLASGLDICRIELDDRHSSWRLLIERWGRG